MIANLGYGVLLITFIVSIYGIVAAFLGARKNRPAWVDSARNAMLLAFPLTTIAVLSLLYLLVSGHYEIQYVAEVGSNSMPLYLRLTALWGGQAGSLLFWSWLLSAFASAVCLRKWDRDREFLPWVILVSLVTLVFFLILNIFVENPFISLWKSASGSITGAMFQPAGMAPYIPLDGNGLNPLLRHPGMIIHPPLLYLGFVSFVIPYAFAMASLITGRTDDRWIRITRRWTLVAWLFLSLGLVVGAWWAYQVLGWGGYWGWDPVELAAFMPWLTGAAFLHSVMIQEKRGMLKQWSMLLIILTYDAVIYGTFLSRSGVLNSIHAFAQSAIGLLFFVFIGVTLITSLLMLILRWDSLRSKVEMTSMLSREALFLLNNFLFIGVFVVCFVGVNFPILAEALGIVGQKIRSLAGIFTGQKITVGPSWYKPIVSPIFAALVLLMAIAPLSAWKYSTAKTIGNTIWKPFAASLLIVPVLFIAGMRSWVPLLGFWLCAFAPFVTLYEYWRATWARHKARGEPLNQALWHMVGKNRRRYGGYIVHIAVLLMALGIIGIEIFQTETQGTIPQGGTLNLGRYTIRYDKLAVWDTNDGLNIARAEVSVYKDGNPVGKLYPRREYYYEAQQPITIAGVRSTLEDDLKVLLVDWQPLSTSAATFKVFHNPLVKWLWVGAWVFIVGTLVAAWPDKKAQVEALQEAVPIAAQVRLDHDN